MNAIQISSNKFWLRHFGLRICVWWYGTCSPRTGRSAQNLTVVNTDKNSRDQ